jgi:hypothetical protein
MEWYQRNKDWFNKDAVLTASARVLDQQMVADGYTPDDPDYFDELDSRLKREFPQKFGGKAAAARPASNNPTIQNRSAPSPAPGKIRVSITQADRDMANHLGISIEQYAREKAKTERAQQQASELANRLESEVKTPADLDKVLGRVATRDLAFGEPLDWGMVG